MVSIIHGSGFGSPATICCLSASESAARPSPSRASTLLAFAQKELLGVGREIYSATFNATAWLGSAAGFLIVTLPMIRVVTLLERKLRSGLTTVIGG